MSYSGVSIDQRIRRYFNQGLTQAETTLCLSVREEHSDRHSSFKEKMSPAEALHTIALQ